MNISIPSCNSCGTLLEPDKYMVIKMEKKGIDPRKIYDLVYLECNECNAKDKYKVPDYKRLTELEHSRNKMLKRSMW